MISTLQAHGWKITDDHGNSVKLRRPGKATGSNSSELKRSFGPKNVPVFHVFSSDAYPFDADRTYDSYGVWTVLEHGGDFSDAGKAARQMYPDSPPGSSIESSRKQEETPAYVKDILANRWDIRKPPIQTDPRITWQGQPNGRIIKLAVRGSMCAIKGSKGSRKSFLLQQLERNGLTGGNILGFKVDLQGKKILHIDTEMEPEFVDERYRLMAAQIGAENMDNLLMHFVRDKSSKERMGFIDWVLHHEYKDEVGLIVIDGVTDIVRDFNDKAESSDLANWLMYIGELTGAPTLNVIHNNPGSFKARGHAGTEVENKAAVLFNVEKNDWNESTVRCDKTRGGPPFATMHFTQYDDGSLKVLEQLSETVSYTSKGKKF